jgi:hypothetical protein
MLFTWLATLLALPVAYGWRGPRPLVREPGSLGGLALLDRALAALARLPIARPRAAALLAAALFGGLGAIGLRVGRECYLLDDLPESSPIVADRRRVEAKLGGTFSLVVHVRGARPGALLEPDALRTLAACEAALAAEGAVEGTTSILDWLREAHLRLALEEAAVDPLPRTRGLAAQELLFCEDRRETPTFIDHDYAEAAVHARVRDLGSTRMRAVIGRVRERLAGVQADAPAGVRIALTGLPVVMQGVFDEVVPDLAASFGLSLALGLAVFTALFRSARYGLVAVVPNALPSLATFAFMAALGIDLKPSTVIVFSVAFAIAADDTIHYLARYRRYLRSGDPLAGLAPDDPEGAATLALRESGLAIALTSTALALGFAVLAASQFLPVVYLGALTGFTLLAAAGAEMLVTPLLALTFLRRARGR